jgi:hypothetical protein
MQRESACVNTFFASGRIDLLAHLCTAERDALSQVGLCNGPAVLQLRGVG